MTTARTCQKMNGVLHCVQKLVQRFCFWPKIFRLAVHQAMVQMHQKMNVTLRSKIGAEILFFAKNFQEGRAPNFGAAAPKNERSVTSGSGSVVLPFFQLCQFLTNPKRKHPLFARQAAYTPPWEEIVPYHVYSPSRGKTNAHGGDKRVVFQNPHCGLIIDDSYHKKCNRSTEVLHRADK